MEIIIAKKNKKNKKGDNIFGGFRNDVQEVHHKKKMDMGIIKFLVGEYPDLIDTVMETESLTQSQKEELRKIAEEASKK